jgi:uncharacterized protein
MTPQFGLSFRPHFLRAKAEDLLTPKAWEFLGDNWLDAPDELFQIVDYLRSHGAWIALHFVSLNVGGSDPFSAVHLSKVKKLIQKIKPDLVSDHLAWSQHQGKVLFDLLPIPFLKRQIPLVCDRILALQDTLECTLALENPSRYFDWPGELSEWDFLTQVCQKSGCKVLLDLNNILVNQHHFPHLDALTPINLKHLEHLPVAQFHVAGYRDEGDAWIDDHGAAPSADLNNWVRCASQIFPKAPFVLEWDNNTPDLSVCLEILKQFSCEEPALETTTETTWSQKQTQFLSWIASKGAAPSQLSLEKAKRIYRSNGVLAAVHSLKTQCPEILEAQGEQNFRFLVREWMDGPSDALGHEDPSKSFTEFAQRW